MLWFRCANIEQDVTSPSNRCSQLRQTTHACCYLKNIKLDISGDTVNISSHLWSHRKMAPVVSIMQHVKD